MLENLNNTTITLKLKTDRSQIYLQICHVICMFQFNGRVAEIPPKIESEYKDNMDFQQPGEDLEIVGVDEVTEYPGCQHCKTRLTNGFCTRCNEQPGRARPTECLPVIVQQKNGALISVTMHEDVFTALMRSHEETPYMLDGVIFKGDSCQQLCASSVVHE